MKTPEKPPNWRKTLHQMDAARFSAILGSQAGHLVNGRYVHWDKLRHLKPPDGFSTEEWWLSLKIHRRGSFKAIPLKSKDNEPFSYSMVDPIPEHLHHIDQGSGGLIQMPDQITNPETRDEYYVGSLIEEAITSSQLEGAVSTREEAKQMLRAGRPPKNDSEQMILNNYTTMREIKKLSNEALTKKLIFHIHESISKDTIPQDALGRFRRAGENRVVGDEYGEILHAPPDASEIDKRVEAMCAFANGESPSGFVHPALRSILLHFWLAYDHPFWDGNGRTARALFYWSMLRHHFWLFEFISISERIIKAPIKYARAFLYTETDENDLTYFILHQLDIIKSALAHLHEYIQKKTKAIKAVEARLHGSTVLNHRQESLIAHALRHPKHRYTIREHQRSHNVVYQTARTDLNDLLDRGLMRMRKAGRVQYFSPAENLEERLAAL